MGARRIMPNGSYVDGTHPIYTHTPVEAGAPGRSVVIRTDGQCTVIDDNKKSSVDVFCNGQAMQNHTMQEREPKSIRAIKMLNGVAAQDELKNEAITRSIPPVVLDQIRELAKNNGVLFTFEEVNSPSATATIRTPSAPHR